MTKKIFTGYKDKNGTPIYVGDKVIWSNFEQIIVFLGGCYFIQEVGNESVLTPLGFTPVLDFDKSIHYEFFKSDIVDYLEVIK